MSLAVGPVALGLQVYISIKSQVPILQLLVIKEFESCTLFMEIIDHTTAYCRMAIVYCHIESITWISPIIT